MSVWSLLGSSSMQKSPAGRGNDFHTGQTYDFRPMTPACDPNQQLLNSNMLEITWRRIHGGGIMEEEYGGEIMEEESLRRNHGGGIMEEESWRRNHAGGIMEEGSWKRNHGGESWRRNHG